MAITLMTVPANNKSKLKKISHNLVKSLKTEGLRVKLFRPIEQKPTVHSKSLSTKKIEHLLSKGLLPELLDDIIALYEEISQDADIVIIQGLQHGTNQDYTTNLNVDIANALDARVIIVASNKNKITKRQIQITARAYNERSPRRVLGYIINKQKTFEKITNPKTAPIFNLISKSLDTKWICELVTEDFHRHHSAARFRYEIVTKAQLLNKTIVLPEADDPRILIAARICSRRKIANCILLGNPNKIAQLATHYNIILPSDIKIYDPEKIRHKYIEPLLDIRSGKGLTKDGAKTLLQDNHVLATMMLQQGEVDGVTAGAAHHSADIIRAACQLIARSPNHKFVSSVFFMCLPEQVLVFADCAINPDPNATKLAHIAIDAHDIANKLGIDSRVAMISYATGQTKPEPTVDKIVKATNIAKELRPNIVIDGPLQYDAALIQEVAYKKAPNSLVAGKATVLVFPDLNCANTVYKAVQRSANVVSIGPILLGLDKPVNDLSRGATVNDIVYTIAVTAIEAD